MPREGRQLALPGLQKKIVAKFEKKMKGREKWGERLDVKEETLQLLPIGHSGGNFL